MGFEPTTTRITIWDSTVELRPPLIKHARTPSGLPGGNRTHNPQLRRLVLYPVELRAAGQTLSCNDTLVGVRGFEPPTSWSQTRRATGLRYTPKRARMIRPSHPRSNEAEHRL